MNTESSKATAASTSEDERAERILASARELLLAWGYKRVTVGEIARHARIGKGTVYLHWKTKEVLFAELLRREFQDVVEVVVAQIEEDPAAALPDRVARETFLQQARNPLAHAIRTNDGDVLGALVTTREGNPLAREIGHYTLLVDLVEAWRHVGALPSDVPAADQVYGIDAILSGFITSGVVPEEDSPGLERRADLLAHAVKRSFAAGDDSKPVAMDAAAQEVLKVLGKVRAAPH